MNHLKMCIGLHVNSPFLLSSFNKTNFRGIRSKNIEILNFMKILQVGVELFHADRRIAIKLIVAFSNFANAPYNCDRG